LTTRTKSTTATFQHPFILPGLEKLQPAGSYIVETEEELLDTVSFAAWKRLTTTIRLTADGSTEYWPVDPDDLREALRRDGARTGPPNIMNLQERTA
jgi:hypothetical protein